MRKHENFLNIKYLSNCNPT